MTIANDGVEAWGSAACLSRMLQFGDSMFPIGAFAFSSGLESAIQKGVVTNAATLRAFARTALEQAARGDCIALIAAHRAATAGDVDTLARIDAQVYARKLSDEARTMSVRTGKKFTEMGVDVVDAPLLRTWHECIEKSATPGCYPIALAINFAVQDLPASQAFVVHQYGVATTMVIPSPERFTSVSQNSRRETGSTPVVGSSKSKIRGWAINAQASASFCFIPPLSLPASRSVNRSISNILR